MSRAVAMILHLRNTGVPEPALLRQVQAAIHVALATQLDHVSEATLRWFVGLIAAATGHETRLIISPAMRQLDDFWTTSLYEVLARFRRPELTDQPVANWHHAALITEGVLERCGVDFDPDHVQQLCGAPKATGAFASQHQPSSLRLRPVRLAVS
jgi:hypothetical protein